MSSELTMASEPAAGGTAVAEDALPEDTVAEDVGPTADEALDAWFERADIVAPRERPWSRFVSMFQYALRDAVQGIKRRPALAASAALTVSLCAALAGGAAVARAGVDATMARWADGVEFVVYLHPSATDKDAERVRSELESSGGVRAIDRVTQDEAFAEYSEIYAEESQMVEAVTPDLLPSSFRVTPERADPALIRDITDPLASDAAVYQVVTADDAVQDVRDLSGAVSGVGTWLAVVLGIVGIVLSATMIRSSVTARRREIEMMRAVGAGRTYIAAPVAIEGVLIGMAGAGLAAFLLGFGLSKADGSTSAVVSSLLPSTSVGRGVVLAVIVITVAICTAVSVATTASTLRRSR